MNGDGSRAREGMMTRRGFLKFGLAGAACLSVPQLAWARLLSHAEERFLTLYNTNTGEMVKSVYWAQGKYLPEGVRQINWILRDFHVDKVVDIDKRLMDLLFILKNRLRVRDAFHIDSGYRSPQTNAELSKHNPEVAKHSFHIEAMAADIAMPRVELIHLHRAALSLGLGGVGYYPGAGFVHVDVGPVRHWQF